jgi:ATPase subunit of ABC transporter with duplicated ATPase domains
MTTLQVKNVTIIHKKDLTCLVDHLSVVVSPGDRVALIGEEGNGKSTVLKLLYDPALVEEYAEWQGEIVDRGLRKGYLAQELSPEALEQPVLEFCQQAPGFLDADPGQLGKLAKELGLELGLFYDWRPVGTLSGGERVKLRLALLLLAQPDVLLLDEPSNDLDVETVAWLEEFLLGCSVPVVYISHDEALLRRTATKIIHLERLRRRTTARCTVANLSYEAYTAQRQENFLRQEQQARKEAAEYEAKMETFRQIRSKVEHDQATISRGDPHGGRLLKKKMHAVQSMGHRFQREKERMTLRPEWEEAILTQFDRASSALPQGKTVLRLELESLTAGETVLSHNVQLWVTGPEKIGIVGRNGVGKSTLLKRIAQELLPRTDLRCAYMAQDYGDQLLGEKTPVELLAPSGRREDVTRARTLLGSMKYQAEEMEHPAAGLSGGQKAKLLFLHMVLSGANVLVLDEPTRNFSPLSAPVIRQVLAEFPGGVISVSHDRLYLEQVCDRVLELTEEGLKEVPFQAE